MYTHNLQVSYVTSFVAVQKIWVRCNLNGKERETNGDKTAIRDLPRDAIY